MPNTKPLTTTQAALNDKLQRAANKCLVNYGFFMGATAENLPDLREANPACGIKIFMGSAHGALLVSTEEEIEPIFAVGKRLIAVHAEDRARIEARRQQFTDLSDRSIHSTIQDEQAALNATKLALKLSKKYRRRLHILHLSTGVEAELLRHESAIAIARKQRNFVASPTRWSYRFHRYRSRTPHFRRKSPTLS